MTRSITSLFSAKKKAKEQETEEQKEQLIRAIEEIRRQTAAAYSAFNNAVDGKLIEALIYEIKSLQAKYNYYLSCAKLEKIERSSFVA